MKKAYINPETSIVLLAGQTIICTSVDGFNGTLDDEETIETSDMEDEELEEEY